LNDFVAGALARREIRILSDGTPWRPLIHVDDMARAIEWAATRALDAGGPFLVVNAGSDEWNYRVRDLAEAAAAAIPGAAISVNPHGQPDKRSYRVSFEQFRRLAPAHVPIVGLQEAIAGLRDGLAAAGGASEGFPAARLIRLKTLMHLRESGRLAADLKWRRAVPVAAVA
jgi:nucleoside-diphosphate-sugar epimerase